MKRPKQPNSLNAAERSNIAHTPVTFTTKQCTMYKDKLGFELDLSGLPMVNRQYGLKGAMMQAISICKAQ